MATVTASLETQSLVQESRHTYQEMHVTETRQVKKKTKSKRHKDEASISVSKSSEKLHKKLKACNGESNPQCEKCARPVYAMERVKAERRAWHKECFRCVQCNKQLTVETYQSDHTTLYCKPHFKQLFEPKPVDDEDETDVVDPSTTILVGCTNGLDRPVKYHDHTEEMRKSKSSEKLHKKLKACNGESNPQCEKCARPVYAMERVKAERRAWHKECFRCVQCNKQLTVETYQSDHTTLYCKPHFKQLFEPKPVDDEDETDAAPKKHQMIICESNPVELPPDVVRASDKPDLGLEELAQLDVKSRFEVFERAAQKTPEPPLLEPRAPREKSSALLSKIAKFKAKGMDIGVSDEYLNGVEVEHSSSEQEDDDDEDSVLKKSYKQTSCREQPVSFCNMSEIVGKFEAGQHAAADRHRERKQEIQNIRSRLFMGKQAKIKEMYEQSVMQSEQSQTSAEKICRELELDAEKARQIKQRFENGAFNDENQPPKNRDIDDKALFNEGIAKKSRSIFLELDANAKSLPVSPPPQDVPKRKEIPFVPKDVVRAADRVEDVKIETADISDRFRFFETYRPS
ncbi:Pollen-specific protein SF3 [Papilio machaon]|uniref:Pollen-specific protein SF3 n=1 Tax=Papilio machaon TaxID=76193 RepID=A0A0N1IQ26_PAPMA|nr:Pollen-specific protein SF3 [Papilio machaon]